MTTQPPQDPAENPPEPAPRQPEAQPDASPDASPDAGGGTTTPPVAASPSAAPEDLIGCVINNNYRVLRLIGRGGMGEVYEGEHLFTGNRIAIKMVLQSLSRDPQILALFKREARTLFQLTDDSIARYLDSVHDPLLDRYCLIMDYIEGIHLSDHVAQHGPLTVEAARQLALRLAGGLARAHRLGITHRDLSPDNVMLRGGDVGQAVLIDFGIARSEGGDATLHGQLAGKFKYISPEQLGHFDGEIGPRTDVYGLGLILAMALRGTPIDMGNSVVAAVEARRRVPPLDGVPPVMLPLLTRMLQPDPAHRPASMADVVALIEAPPQGPQTLPPGGLADGDRTVLISHPGLSHPPGGEGPQHTVIAAPGTLSAPPGQSMPPMQAGGIMTAPGMAGSWPIQGSQTAPPGATGFEGGFQGLPQPPQPLPGTATGGGKSPRGVMLTALAAVTALALGGGWFLMQDETPADPVTAAEAPQTGTTQTEAPGGTSPAASLPPPDPSTREGLLAAKIEPASCAYATRITAGGNSGRIEVFGTDPVKSAAISAAYGSAFGVAPATVNRQITEAQCGALDLVRGLQGRNNIAPQLTLDGDSMASGGSLIGRISDTRGRVIWLFLVSASGAVHDLSSRLEAQADGSWLFAIGAKSDSGRPEPLLLVAITTDTPLVTAAAAPAGASAAQLLPAVLAEIAGRKENAAGQIAWFQLTP